MLPTSYTGNIELGWAWRVGDVIWWSPNSLLVRPAVECATASD
jgi:hypothetical protein